MSKLQELYSQYDADTDRMKETESRLIAEEIIPAIEKKVKSILKELRCPLRLEIDYDPKGGLTVKTRCDENEVAEETPTTYQAPETDTDTEVRDSGEELTESSPKSKASIKRSHSRKLRVWISEEAYIQEEKASQTLIKAVEIAGAQRVSSLNINCDSYNLVSKEEHPKYKRNQKEISDGYLVNTHSETKKSKSSLNKYQRNFNWVGKWKLWNNSMIIRVVRRVAAVYNFQ